MTTILRINGNESVLIDADKINALRSFPMSILSKEQKIAHDAIIKMMALRGHLHWSGGSGIKAYHMVGLINYLIHFPTVPLSPYRVRVKLTKLAQAKEKELKNGDKTMLKAHEVLDGIMTVYKDRKGRVDTVKIHKTAGVAGLSALMSQFARRGLLGRPGDVENEAIGDYIATPMLYSVLIDMVLTEYELKTEMIKLSPDNERMNDRLRNELFYSDMWFGLTNAFDMFSVDELRQFVKNAKEGFNAN